jgi:copper chaperone CopZ
MDRAPCVTVLEIDDVTCPRCSERLRAALAALPGVVVADVSWPAGQAWVPHTGEVTSEQLTQAIAAASVGTRHHYRVHRVHHPACTTGISGGKA